MKSYFIMFEYFKRSVDGNIIFNKFNWGIFDMDISEDILIEKCRDMIKEKDGKYIEGTVIKIVTFNNIR